MTYWGTKLKSKEVKIGHLCRGNYKVCTVITLEIHFLLVLRSSWYITCGNKV